MINNASANQFFSSLDAMIASPRAPRVKAPKKAPARRGAKEELTKNSTQDEFITQFVEAVASFILNSRDAFDVEDATALKEFTGVLQVEEVQNKILEYLANPPADKEEIVENVPDQSEAPKEGDELLLDDDEGADAPAASADDSDYVSDDVMQLLEEDEER